MSIPSYDLADQQSQLSIFEAISKNNLDRLRELAETLLQSGGEIAAPLLCLDHFFTSPPKIQAASNKDVSSVLQLFQKYIRLLRRISVDQTLVANPSVLKLFAIQESDQIFLLPSGSYLHKFVLDHKVAVMRVTEEGAFVPPRETSWAINQAATHRLRIRILQEDDMCRKARAFSPICLSDAVYKQCNRIDCSRRHLDLPKLSAEWYTVQIRVYLQQFVILQVLFLHTRHSRRFVN